MPEGTIDKKLISYIQDAHAMESNVLRMLDSMIATTTDQQIKSELEHHKTETKQHLERLQARLDAHGKSPATVTKEAPGILGALFKGVQDQVRTDKPGKNARDGYVTEALEIAAYELLERIAEQAGDAETAEVARRNRQDEYAMRDKIEKTWDKVVVLTLEEEGIRA